MPRPISPAEEVLLAAFETLEAAGLDITLDMPDLKFRHARNRYTVSEEKPCMAIAFVSDGPQDRNEGFPTTNEARRALSIDLIADVSLETEVEDDYSGFDPTKFGALLAMVFWAVGALKSGFTAGQDNPTPLSYVADDVEQVEIDPDEDLEDEEGRLVGRINVLYRVSAEDPTVLIRR